jgi:hypothetical protein
MKMGTTLSPCPYDAATRHALQSVCLRWPAILRYDPWAAAGFWRVARYPPIAALSINPEIDVMGHNPTSRYSFSLCRSLCDFAGAVDEKPCDRAERAVLQGDDSIRPARHWQFNGQHLELRALGEKSKCGSRENGDKTAGRQQTNAHMRAIRDHAHPRIIEPAGAESFPYDRSNYAVRRWQHP